ncbi:MAG: cation-translocating P-type ATPase [Clostridiales bacterium]|nr:cation-translocating P-type ATPase [Clostridiales bacterium]
MKHYLESREAVLASAGIDESGLTPAAAKARLEQNGKNKLDEGKAKPLAVKLFEQMKDPMIGVLIAAAVVSGAFGEIPDMVIIFAVVALNAVLGVVQENKAEKAIEALSRMSAPTAKVRRGGEVLQIKTEDIVVGDIILLEAGDSVPADMRLIECASLKVEEAALTGESVAVEKTTGALEAGSDDVALGERFNMAYMGTNAVYGRGAGVAVATGMATEMGKIADMLSRTKEEKTPLQNRLASLSKILSIVVLGICVFIFIFTLLRSGDFGAEHIFRVLLTAVSLAVAAVPEGLVVVVTVLLSIGVTKMSKRNSIIRRLTAVETLGCTQVICSDKTGTLTQNKMTVADYFGNSGMLAEAMILCNDASENRSGGFVGEPTEIGLLQFAKKTLSKSKEDMEKSFPRVGEAPFDSIRKMMSTVHSRDGAFRQYTKGAPDEVLNCCSFILNGDLATPLTDELKAQVLEENRRMADNALRVLAAAQKDYDALPPVFSPEALESNLTFTGLSGMIDPVRPEVKAAVEECRDAGLRVVMITGDHKNTAAAIANELGILSEGRKAVTGAELARMSDPEFDDEIENISVYARVQPEHKVRIVEAWKKKEKITAMTGDGVNDAPALKSADIGVGMGITGTDVTKNTADMVLADDNFATIVYAVEEGRRIYENILKAVQFLLASNLSEVVSIFTATLFGFTIFAPIHILWINLVTDTFPAMALGMEDAEADIMKKPPRSSKEGIFTGRMGFDILYQGIAIAALTLASFLLGNAKSEIAGMTMAFLTLSLCEIIHSVNLRSRTKSIFSSRGVNIYLVGAIALTCALTLGAVYIPGINAVFKLTALPIGMFLQALGLAAAIIPIVELEKAFARLAAKKS